MLPAHMIVIAGPNGAGKSTSAPALLRDTLAIVDYVNADAIAHGLSAFRPERAAVPAGRVALERLRHLAHQRTNFAFESTLAGRTLAGLVTELKSQGYVFHLEFLWLQDPDLAVARVQERVRAGGHDVSEPVVRRRYERGLTNFFHLYRPLADDWRVYDNSGRSGPQLVATGTGRVTSCEYDSLTWQHIVERAHG